jgi:hypothetical protein
MAMRGVCALRACEGDHPSVQLRFVDRTTESRPNRGSFAWALCDICCFNKSSVVTFAASNRAEKRGLCTGGDTMQGKHPTTCRHSERQTNFKKRGEPQPQHTTQVAVPQTQQTTQVAVPQPQHTTQVAVPQPQHTTQVAVELLILLFLLLVNVRRRVG